MYSNYKLKTSPSFKMQGTEFNTLVNSMTKDKITHNHKPVKLGVTIRTKTTNLVAKQDNSILLECETESRFGEGFFNIISNAQRLIINTFGEIDFGVISNTVFLPIGAFENEEEITVYCHLIIDDEHVEVFSIKDSINFVPIGDNSLNNLNNKSIIVLQTLSIVK